MIVKVPPGQHTLGSACVGGGHSCIIMSASNCVAFKMLQLRARAASPLRGARVVANLYSRSPTGTYTAGGLVAQSSRAKLNPF